MTLDLRDVEERERDIVARKEIPTATPDPAQPE